MYRYYNNNIIILYYPNLKFLEILQKTNISKNLISSLILILYVSIIIGFLQIILYINILYTYTVDVSNDNSILLNGLVDSLATMCGEFSCFFFRFILVTKWIWNLYICTRQEKQYIMIRIMCFRKLRELGIRSTNATQRKLLKRFKEVI